MWSGSRAVNVFIDTITVMYGLDGVRGIVKTRLMAFLLFIVALLIGSIALPLMVAGPDAVVQCRALVDDGRADPRTGRW
ncbi:hypothetical protein SHIRM173S_05011 [Streptomyces hirsutus]